MGCRVSDDAKCCLPSLASRCNLYLLDIYSFLIKYECSLKVAAPSKVYSVFAQQPWAIISHFPLPPALPTHQFFTPCPPTPPMYPYQHLTHD